MSLMIPVIHEADSAQPVAVSEAVFGQPYNAGLVHQLVVAYQTRGRAGTKAQKGRSDVSGGGKKPWRQKGTGHARAGSSRSPIWRTGGKVFAARPREFDIKWNKKMYRAGIRSILSELLREGRLFTAADIFPSEPKTKLLSQTLKGYGLNQVLIVASDIDHNLELAARNIPGIAVHFNAKIDPVSLVSSQQVILTKEAVAAIEERLA